MTMDVIIGPKRACGEDLGYDQLPEEGTSGNLILRTKVLSEKRPKNL